MVLQAIVPSAVADAARASAPSPFAPPAAVSQWRNRFAGLGGRFSTELGGAALPQPRWVAVSPSCTEGLGWPADWWQRPEALAAMSGGLPWPGMRPLASVYSGHQFGVWAGQLGDGRALLLGEVETPNGPMEVQLKGAGRTPYSRGGDGRAVLRSTVREFLCSEAMAALGVPTTRALCMVASPLPVRRETLETAAVVARVAPSFVRFGHFEHFAHTAQDLSALQALLDFVIEHHYPEAASAPKPAVALLEAVTRRTAELVAHWQAIGFCHGVMNTDNMSILGLTIDYGPFGFLDGFDPGHICNHSDSSGRYAWRRQPQAALWNLHALAQALLPLAGGDSDALLAALEVYKTVFPQARLRWMRAKLGLSTAEDGDETLADDLLRLMAAERADFTITFRLLAGPKQALADRFVDRPGFDAWHERYGRRLAAEGSDADERAERMRRVNPKFVLRNHSAQAAIEAAERGDDSEVGRLLAVLQRPFDEQPGAEPYAEAPPASAPPIEVSCSS